MRQPLVVAASVAMWMVPAYSIWSDVAFAQWATGILGGISRSGLWPICRVLPWLCR